MGYSDIVDGLAEFRPGIFQLLTPNLSHNLLIYPRFCGWEEVPIRPRAYDKYDFDLRDRGDGAFVLLQLTIRGQCTLVTEQKQSTIGPGQAMVLRTPGPYRYYFTPTRECPVYEFIFVELGGHGVIAWAEELIGRHGNILNVPENDPLVRDLLVIFRSGVKRRTAGVLDTLCATCHHLTLQVGQLMANEGSSMPESIHKIYHIIEDNFWDSEFNVATIAKMLDVSQEHLSRLFSKCTGQTLKRVILQFRLNKSMDLLSRGVSVEDASRQCGYSNLAYFRSEFKRQFGFSPTSITAR